MLGDANEVHMTSKGIPLRATHNVETLLAEWHLTADGRGTTIWPFCVVDDIHCLAGQVLFGQSTTCFKTARTLKQLVRLTYTYLYHPHRLSKTAEGITASIWGAGGIRVDSRYLEQNLRQECRPYRNPRANRVPPQT